jgi:hypothetical protein
VVSAYVQFEIAKEEVVACWKKEVKWSHHGMEAVPRAADIIIAGLSDDLTW